MSRNSKIKRDKRVRNQKKAKPIINSDKLSVKLRAERTKYSTQWTNSNAIHFETGGYYTWMANFIVGFDKVLEIGTGGGQGTVELAKRGHRIISIEENPIVLDSAEKYIMDSGIKCTRIRRESISSHPYCYKIKYRHFSEPDVANRPEVLLIEGDILNDPNLFEWLKIEPQFDTVICWLMGTHSARIYNDAIIKLEIPSPGDYRLHVQNTVYELADVILRPGGKLHIVDRTQKPDCEEIRKDFIDSHKAQARATSMQVDQLDFIVYEESNNVSKIEMCTTLPLTGEILEFNEKAFTSILSHKP